jgi:hypothetical protein
MKLIDVPTLWSQVRLPRIGGTAAMRELADERAPCVAARELEAERRRAAE